MKFLPKGRLDAFADGVFAIVITLLVLDLVVPQGPGNIISGLMQEWPAFLAYLISFAFIGSAWISHSSITSLMKQETPHSYRLNLLMLFFVTLLPFTTKLMATHLGLLPTNLTTISGLSLLDFAKINTIERATLLTPVVIYGLNLLAVTLALIAILKSAILNIDIHADESVGNELNSFLRKEQFSATIIVGAMIFAVFFPLIAVCGFILVSILFFVTPTFSTVKATLKKR
jgi:TMEM175 potassium channel family protein